jgi:uncharacterized membrane protein YeiH
MDWTDGLFLLGSAVFAVTGVLAAARQDMDVMSFLIVGVVTAVGGGTLRDLILDAPVFWVEDVAYVYVAAGAALATFVFEQRFRATLRAFLYLDALATALFAILSTGKALALGAGPGVALLMGVVTGIGGGVIRDLLVGHPTLLLSRELFMTPVLVGSALHAAGIALGAAAEPLALAAIAVTAGIRAGAIRFGWSFPDWLTHQPLG